MLAYVTPLQGSVRKKHNRLRNWAGDWSWHLRLPSGGCVVASFPICGLFGNPSFAARLHHGLQWQCLGEIARQLQLSSHERRCRLQFPCKISKRHQMTVTTKKTNCFSLKKISYGWRVWGSFLLRLWSWRPAWSRQAVQGCHRHQLGHLQSRQRSRCDTFGLPRRRWNWRWLSWPCRRSWRWRCVQKPVQGQRIRDPLCCSDAVEL